MEAEGPGFSVGQCEGGFDVVAGPGVGTAARGGDMEDARFDGAIGSLKGGIIRRQLLVAS